MNIVTCIAPVNIAVIKYWGKRDEKLILPLNDSVSLTLDVDLMQAKTTIMASPDFKENKLWLNGREENFDNPRIQSCLNEIKNRALESQDVVNKEIINHKLHICSENNFPTAAGLASSAAGYACLVYTLAQLYGIKGDLSDLARRGSGSACRSVYGGFVRWYAGQKHSGVDSIARPVAPASYWKDIHVLVLVVDPKKKKTTSSTGMQDSVATSELLKHRVKYSVPARVDDIVQAIHDRDFQKFAEITIKDSNQFHAVCLDTYPPALYLNDTSKTIIQLVHSINNAVGELKVAYTFDAGPNACLITLKNNLPLIFSIINYMFPTNGEADYFRGEPIDSVPIPDEIIKSIKLEPQGPGALKYIINTQLGEGPRVLTDEKEHLLNNIGLPKTII